MKFSHHRGNIRCILPLLGLVFALFGMCALLQAQGSLLWMEKGDFGRRPGTIAISKDGQMVAVVTEGAISVRNRESGEEMERISITDEDPRNRGPEGMSFSHDGTQLAWVDRDGFVSVYDLRNQRRTATWPSRNTPEAKRPAAPIQFLPERNRLLIARQSGNALDVRSAGSGKVLETVEADGVRARGGSLSLSDGGVTLAYGGGVRGGDVHVHVYDMRRQRTRHIIETGTDYGVSALALSRNGHLLATASSRGTDPSVDFWSVQTGAHLGRLPIASEWLAFMGDGQVLAVLNDMDRSGERDGLEALEYWRVTDLKKMATFPMEPFGGRVGGFVLAPDSSGGLFITGRATAHITADGERRHGSEVLMAGFSTPVLITQYLRQPGRGLVLSWIGGKGPYELLFKSEGSARWRTEWDFLEEQTLLIPHPHSGMLYRVRSMNP